MFADEGHIRDTMMERGRAMRGLRIPMRQTLAVLITGVLVCGSSGLAQSQTASKSTSAAKSKAPAAKQSAAPAKPAAAPAAVGGAEPSLVGQFGTWGAYTATSNGKKVCFALAKPASSKTNPPNRPRDASYAFISTRPAEKVANEVSVMIGYQLKPGSEGTVEIGGARFAMYSQGDGLWIKNAAEEDRMVEALRKGADATVKGVSAKGTETIDVFPLKGLAQALDKLAKECRR
jgi:invasion protein IalB